MDQQHQDQGQPDGTDHNPLSCADIAKKLNRNPVSVFRAIRRLGILPHTTAGKFKFYAAADVDRIGAGMRRANGNKVTLPEPVA